MEGCLEILFTYYNSSKPVIIVQNSDSFINTKSLLGMTETAGTYAFPK